MAADFSLPLVAYLALCLDWSLGETEVKISRTVPKRRNKVLLKAKCVFKITERIEIGDAQFTLNMDTPLTKVKSKQVTVLSSEADQEWVMENLKVMKPTKFVVLFSGFYAGDANTPVPSGTCSDLRLAGATTTAEPTTTTAEPTTTTAEPTTTTAEPTTTTPEATTSTPEATTSTSEVTTSTPEATTSSEQTTSSSSFAVPASTVDMASAGGCHTVQAACELQVDAPADPHTVHFNLTFSTVVGRFSDNYGTYISQASEPGRWIYTSNRFQLDPPSFRYVFSFTYHGDTEPEVLCNSMLPPSSGDK